VISTTSCYVTPGCVIIIIIILISSAAAAAAAAAAVPRQYSDDAEIETEIAMNGFICVCSDDRHFFLFCAHSNPRFLFFVQNNYY